MRFLFAALLLSISVLGAPLRAGDHPVVVELFTSQGCSSCPPADRLLDELVAKRNVIALSLHVDYWDYIGWKDQFADPAYSKRQKQYAHIGGRNMVYTPQMIINGQDDVVGARSMELADKISAHRALPKQADLQLKRSGNKVTVGLVPLDTDLRGPFALQLVRYTPERTVHIKRGENAGRTLTYKNVVDAWDVIGEWDGQSAKTWDIQISGDLPGVLLVQAPGPGAIITAAKID